MFAGADATLAEPGLKAMIVELNGSGERYGFDDAETHRRLLGHGFAPYAYDPSTRELSEEAGISSGQNTLYVRDLEWVRSRLRTAPPFRVLDQEVGGA